jgi:hypothetical protein
MRWVNCAMSRRIWIVLLCLGVVGGYGASIAHLILHHRMPCRDAWKDRVAEVCVRAAERVRAEPKDRRPPAAPAPDPR